MYSFVLLFLFLLFKSNLKKGQKVVILTIFLITVLFIALFAFAIIGSSSTSVPNLIDVLWIILAYSPGGLFSAAPLFIILLIINRVDSENKNDNTNKGTKITNIVSLFLIIIGGLLVITNVTSLLSSISGGIKSFISEFKNFFSMLAFLFSGIFLLSGKKWAWWLSLVVLSISFSILLIDVVSFISSSFFCFPEDLCRGEKAFDAFVLFPSGIKIFVIILLLSFLIVGHKKYLNLPEGKNNLKHIFIIIILIIISGILFNLYNWKREQIEILNAQTIQLEGKLIAEVFSFTGPRYLIFYGLDNKRYILTGPKIDELNEELFSVFYGEIPWNIKVWGKEMEELVKVNPAGEKIPQIRLETYELPQKGWVEGQLYNHHATINGKEIIEVQLDHYNIAGENKDDIIKFLYEKGVDSDLGVGFKKLENVRIYGEIIGNDGLNAVINVEKFELGTTTLPNF